MQRHRPQGQIDDLVVVETCQWSFIQLLPGPVAELIRPPTLNRPKAEFSGDKATLEHIRGQFSLARHLAALRPGEIVSPTASAKSALRSIARRWLVLHEEICQHEEDLERLVEEKAPDLMRAHGNSSLNIAEMFILVGDNPERIRS
jgi:hypothetical protein